MDDLEALLGEQLDALNFIPPLKSAGVKVRPVNAEAAGLMMAFGTVINSTVLCKVVFEIRDFHFYLLTFVMADYLYKRWNFDNSKSGAQGSAFLNCSAQTSSDEISSGSPSLILCCISLANASI